MNLIKSTYTDGYNKRAIRSSLMSLTNKQKVIGLAGPDIVEYINDMKKKGYKKFILYENNKEILWKQINSFKHIKTPITLIYDDICNVDPDEKDTLYDLDFCTTIKNMEHCIKKFNSNFIMTFSTRIGMNETIELFFKYRDEYIVKEYTTLWNGIYLTIFHTNKDKRYAFVRYKDSSSMCCFMEFTDICIKN